MSAKKRRNDIYTSYILSYLPFLSDMTKELANSNEAPSDQLCTNVGSELANSNEVPSDQHVGSESEEGANILIEPGAFFAAKAAKLLGSEVLNRKGAAAKDADKKKSCLIISFGDYFARKWCPGLTLFYRYVAIKHLFSPFLYIFMCLG
jgi:hypothetical protein